MELAKRIKEFQGPTYEQQNGFLEDFVVPLITTLDFGIVWRNIQRVRKGLPTERLEKEYIQKSEDAGIYNSLSRLAHNYQNIDSILSDMRREITFAKGKSSKMDRITLARNKILSNNNFPSINIHFIDATKPCPCGSGKHGYDCCIN